VEVGLINPSVQNCNLGYQPRNPDICQASREARFGCSAFVYRVYLLVQTLSVDHTYKDRTCLDVLSSLREATLGCKCVILSRSTSRSSMPMLHLWPLTFEGKSARDAIHGKHETFSGKIFEGYLFIRAFLLWLTTQTFTSSATSGIYVHCIPTKLDLHNEEHGAINQHKRAIPAVL
jgi:hypothetical protein